MSELLSIHNVNVAYRVEGKLRTVLQGISLDVGPGESVGLIGESGSGKSTLSETILGTLPLKGGEVLCGGVEFQGTDLLDKKADIIGRSIAYIPQDPNSSLDPLYPVVANFAEILAKNPKSRLSATSEPRTVKVLEKMGNMIHGIDLNSYPHQLSGGMRQRVLIGLALQCVPELIVADEPTSNLDVTLERKIIELFRELKDHHQMSFLLTTHNLALARYFCDRIYVLYEGALVESGPSKQVFEKPKHEYTRALLKAML